MIDPKVDEMWETRDGHIYRIICVDADFRRDDVSRPIIGVRENFIASWTREGRSNSHYKLLTDLIRRVEPEREGIVWVNVDRAGFTYAASSKEDADKIAMVDRIARIRVPWRPGQFDE